MESGFCMGGGCKSCPVENCIGVYRGSDCAAKRAAAGVDYDPLTQAERIRKLDDKGLEDLIRQISTGYEPWCDHHCKMAGDDNCNSCLTKWLSQAVEQPVVPSSKAKEGGEKSEY